MKQQLFLPFTSDLRCRLKYIDFKDSGVFEATQRLENKVVFLFIVYLTVWIILPMHYFFMSCEFHLHEFVYKKLYIKQFDSIFR